MFAKKQVQHGNSLALVIDKPILQLLGADANTFFKIELKDGSLSLTAMEGEARTKTVRQSASDIDAQYGKAFEKMAEMPEEATDDNAPRQRHA